MAGITRAFVGLLDAVAEKPKSQDKPKNNQGCHYEDEDLCSFTHITHFFFSLFLCWVCFKDLNFRNSESEMGLFLLKMGLSLDSFSSSFHGGVEKTKERECVLESLAGWLAWFFVVLRIGKELNVAREGQL